MSKFIEGKENENEIYFKMIRTCSPSTFLDKHCICGHKSEAPHKAGLLVYLISQFDNVFPEERCIHKAPSGRELAAP